MDLYTAVAYRCSKRLTLDYSTSFGFSSRLFSRTLRPHIYAIYGLVRLADEIVDTYRGPDAEQQLKQLEAEAIRALHTGYSSNLLVHAFAHTARQHSIGADLLEPFFASMRMDLPSHTYKHSQYSRYIYGSAEVIGLMCLRVFCNGDDAAYTTLQAGAKALGAAYQKVNFLRDFAADHHKLGRVYFPGITYESFNDRDKDSIIADIQADFQTAAPAIRQLPRSCRLATQLSYLYYSHLLQKLQQNPATVIKKKRIRVSDAYKFILLAKLFFLKGMRA